MGKKICYIIGTKGHGRGGHFYSLKTIAKALSESNSVLVLNIGRKNSAVLDSLAPEIPVYNILFNGKNFFEALSSIKKILKTEQPEIIHLFDSRVYIFARIISNFFKLPLILTKCGGNNYNKLPQARYLTMFSRENEQYYKNNIRYKDCDITLIPNRVMPVRSDFNRIAKLKSSINNNKTIFLRIGRIDQHYYTAILQSINLVKKLNNDGIDSVLLIIGAIQDNEVYIKLKESSDSDILFFNENEWTYNTSEIIDIADFVIGTGRGLMEAASLSKALLTPCNGLDFPVLLNENNFDTLFSTNFSPRNKIENIDNEVVYNEIRKCIADSFTNNHLKELSSIWFEKYFNIKGATVKYNDLYTAVKYKKIKFNLSVLYHYLHTIKYFF